MSAMPKPRRSHRAAEKLRLAPVAAVSLRDQAYAKLKDAIANTDIYAKRQPLRLDERELGKALGVSRTPIREALAILEQERLVKTRPRRGIFLERQSPRENIEKNQMSAALAT